MLKKNPKGDGCHSLLEKRFKENMYVKQELKIMSKVM